MKISLLGIAARDKAIKGMDYVVDAVKATVGPFGSNLLTEKGNRITNDGFTVSREVCSAIENEFERRGALTIHEASSKTNDQVGDATSTAEVLAQAIVKEAVRLLPQEGSFASKKKGVEIIDMVKREKEEVLKKLLAGVKPIETEEELINSAKVSVEDDDLAQLIGSAQWELGKEGIIIAEETPEIKSSIEKIKGIKIDNGLGTSMIINNQEKQTLEVEKCAVILTNYTLQDLNPLKKVIDDLVKNQKHDIVIIARAFTAECIQTCMVNIKNGIRIYPINAPYTNQKEVMKDLEAILGGRYIDTEESTLDGIGPFDVGHASKIIARRYDAVITGGSGDMVETRVKERIEKLEQAKEGSPSEFEKKAIAARISQLSNGFAVLKVGAETDVERKRKKDKADDAVNAVRLALQGGTVKGGGVAFKEIAETLPNEYILKRPLTAIYDQIIHSAPEGFVIEDWVRDPFLVLQCALNNACSVAGTFATINAIVTEENPKTCNCNRSQE